MISGVLLSGVIAYLHLQVSDQCSDPRFTHQYKKNNSSYLVDMVQIAIYEVLYKPELSNGLSVWSQISSSVIKVRKIR